MSSVTPSGFSFNIIKIYIENRNRATVDRILNVEKKINETHTHTQRQGLIESEIERESNRESEIFFFEYDRVYHHHSTPYVKFQEKKDPHSLYSLRLGFFYFSQQQQQQQVNQSVGRFFFSVSLEHTHTDSICISSDPGTKKK